MFDTFRWSGLKSHIVYRATRVELHDLYKHFVEISFQIYYAVFSDWQWLLLNVCFGFHSNSFSNVGYYYIKLQIYRSKALPLKSVVYSGVFEYADEYKQALFSRYRSFVFKVDNLL